MGRGDPCWWREPDGGPKPPAEALLGGALRDSLISHLGKLRQAQSSLAFSVCGALQQSISLAPFPGQGS